MNEKSWIYQFFIAWSIKYNPKFIQSWVYWHLDCLYLQTIKYEQTKGEDQPKPLRFLQKIEKPIPRPPTPSVDVPSEVRTISLYLVSSLLKKNAQNNSYIRGDYSDNIVKRIFVFILQKLYSLFYFKFYHLVLYFSWAKYAFLWKILRKIAHLVILSNFGVLNFFSFFFFMKIASF